MRLLQIALAAEQKPRQRCLPSGILARSPLPPRWPSAVTLSGKLLYWGCSSTIRTGF